MRRIIALLAGIAISSISCAQEFPQRTVRLLVPYGPGDTPDLLARLVALKLSDKYKHQVIVDNKPGANGIIAIQELLNQPADGHTLFLTGNGQVAINPALYKKLPYDPKRDFKPIYQIGIQPFLVWANKELGITDLKGLIALAKSKPGAINYGSAGIGSAHHLCMSALAHNAGIELQHVPYKTARSQLVPGVISNEVSLTCTAVVNGSQMAATGKVIPIAVASNKPHRLAPTFSQAAGISDAVVEAGMGVVARAGTPDAVANQIAADIEAVMQLPDIKERMAAMDVYPVKTGPKEYAEAIARDQKTYAEIVRISGAKVE